MSAQASPDLQLNEPSISLDIPDSTSQLAARIWGYKKERIRPGYMIDQIVDQSMLWAIEITLRSVLQELDDSQKDMFLQDALSRENGISPFGEFGLLIDRALQKAFELQEALTPGREVAQQFLAFLRIR